MINFSGEKFIVSSATDAETAVGSRIPSGAPAHIVQHYINRLEHYAERYGYEFHALSDQFVVFKRIR